MYIAFITYKRCKFEITENPENNGKAYLLLPVTPIIRQHFHDYQKISVDDQ